MFKSKIPRTPVALIFLILSATSFAYGQQPSSTMVANIPFSFVVGKRILPPGEYIVRSLSQAALVIKSQNSQAHTIFLTVPVPAKKKPRAASLVFNRYEDRYFLSVVWIPASRTGRELFKSPLERELAKAIANPQIVAIVALLEAVNVELRF